MEPYQKFIQNSKFMLFKKKKKKLFVLSKVQLSIFSKLLLDIRMFLEPFFFFF